MDTKSLQVQRKITNKTYWEKKTQTNKLLTWKWGWYRCAYKIGFKLQGNWFLYIGLEDYQVKNHMKHVTVVAS